MKHLTLFTLFIAIIAMPVYASAAEAIGTIVEIEGTVKKGKGSLFKPVEIYDPVYLNDTIKTDHNAKTLVMFVDDTQITLGENSELKIDKYIYDPDSAKPPSGKFSVLKGAFLLVSGLIAKTDDPDVEIETAYGSIGLRGTTVWGGPMDGKYSVYVQRGKVNVKNESGEIDLGVGQGTSIISRKHKPRGLGQWGGELINRAVRQTNMKNKDAIKQRVAEMKEMHADMREGRIKDMKDMRKQMIEKRKEETKETIREKTGDLTDEQKDKLKERAQKKKRALKKRKFNN